MFEKTDLDGIFENALCKQRADRAFAKRLAELTLEQRARVLAALGNSSKDGIYEIPRVLVNLSVSRQEELATRLAGLLG